ncbi:MAG: helix-turn-helix domain-containing protein [Devosiaceae bacterium]
MTLTLSQTLCGISVAGETAGNPVLRVKHRSDDADATPSSPFVALRDNGFTQARTRQVESCVAAVFKVHHESLRASTRGKAHVALARQVAMYLCHTTLGFSLTAVGQLFDRDRTTVGHACRRVEDMRDQGDFDALITYLERAVLAGCIPPVLRERTFGALLQQGH